MTTPSARRKTEKAVVRAAMRWFNRRGFLFTDELKVEYPKDAIALENACDRLARKSKRSKNV